MNVKTRMIRQRGKLYHVTMTHADHAMHVGRYHTILKHKQLDTSESFDIFVVMPDDCKTHFNYQITSNSAMTIEVYEDSVVTGVAEASRSRNVIEDNARAPVMITLDGTVVTAGSLIASNTYGEAGVGNTTGQGATEESQGFYLPENKAWRFHVTSLDNNNNINVRMNFIIEPMKDIELN